MNEKQPRSRKKKPFPVKAVAIAAAVLVVCAGSGIGYYVYQAQQYNHVFFPNTVINGMDVSKKTVDQVKEMIASGIQGYSLVLKERGGDTEEIFGAEIDLKSEFDGSLENYLAAQEPMKWFSHRSKKTEYEIPTMIAYDKTKLSEKIDGLVCLREDYAKAPVDAYMSEYQPGIGFSIIPEEQGNLLKKDVLTEGVVHAIDNLSKELDLEELDAYEKPEITSDHEGLQALEDKLNRYVNMTVTYQFGDSRETLGGDVISQWISVGADGTTVLLDRDQVAAYVKGLASKYDTAYKSKTLNTSYGKTVTISKGFYGWKINQGEETSQLYDIIQSGESQTREPVYSQKAFPQIRVFLIFKSFLLPSEHPAFFNSIDHIPGIRINDHLPPGLLQCFQSHDDSQQFHPIVGRPPESGHQFFAIHSGFQYNAEPSRTGISTCSTIGIYNDRISHI